MTMTLYDLSCQRDGHIIGPHAPSCNPFVGVHSRAPAAPPSPRPIGRASRPASERSQDRAHHCAQSKRAPRLRPLHSRGEAPRSQSGAAAGSRPGGGGAAAAPHASCSLDAAPPRFTPGRTARLAPGRACTGGLASPRSDG